MVQNFTYKVNLFLVYNLTGEMIYTIAHRLKSVGTSQVKIKKVVSDLAQLAFSKDSRINLQAVTSVDLVIIANLLYKISHCSIIMLDYQNFSKLFQMILMALKRQLLQCKSYRSLKQITLNHSQGIRDLLEGEFSQVAEDAYLSIEEEFKEVSSYDFYIIRRKLVNLLAFKNYKIGIYL